MARKGGRPRGGGQELCEIKTEKMNAQVESLYDGVITEITGQVGETYDVGAVIGYIEED